MTRPERYERVLTISERVYKTLLKAYPKEFRDEYGPQMVRDFQDLCWEELERGGVAGFGPGSCNDRARGEEQWPSER
ncbi:MAG: hypothetical protein LC781_15470 [Actinobacteria bacterium]|nr:hypothetical protein [Actinomycetota bacterium]